MINCFVNLKTTGLDKNKNGIFDIDFIMEENNKIINVDNFKMNPTNVDFDERALLFSNTTVEKIQQYRDDTVVFFDIENYLIKTLKNKKANLISYNSNFTTDFLFKFFEKFGIVNSFTGNIKSSIFNYFYFPVLDVMQIANLMLLNHRENIDNFKLHTICEVMDIEYNQDLSNASYDNKKVYELFKKIT